MKWLVAIACASCTSNSGQAFECSGGSHAVTLRATPLADLPALDLTYTFSGVTRVLDARVEYGESVPGAGVMPLSDDDGDWFCPTLETSFRSTVAGIAMPIVEDGTTRSCATTTIGESTPVCKSPIASVVIPADVQPGSAELDVGDDSLALTDQLGDMLAARTATPANGSWTFTVGQTATFMWSPATDLAKLTSVLATFPCYGCSDAAGGTVDAAAGTVSFPITALPTTTGTMSIFLSGPVSFSELFTHDATFVSGS
jgi:hypothetical protein